MISLSEHIRPNTRDAHYVVYSRVTTQGGVANREIYPLVDSEDITAYRESIDGYYSDAELIQHDVHLVVTTSERVVMFQYSPKDFDE